jgi:hypothetical protein
MLLQHLASAVRSSLLEQELFLSGNVNLTAFPISSSPDLKANQPRRKRPLKMHSLWMEDPRVAFFFCSLVVHKYVDDAYLILKSLESRFMIKQSVFLQFQMFGIPALFSGDSI